ncbi:MAG: orotidine-5'-phosphate decarboxylase [Candidatus Staskawiczbacteria bacterium]|jgi:orotidine-5'-phosphate decarboxylase
MKKGFRQILAERQKAVNSLVCVGLDPVLEKMPKRFVARHRTDAESVYYWMLSAVEETEPYTCMYKPNSAFWEALPGGAESLKDAIRYIHEEHPGVPVLLDAKRGDIARTQEMYRQAHLSARGQNADGITFSPYMGMDTMEALVDVDNPDSKGLVGLCYTSNPKARQVQDILMVNGRPSWEHYADCILNWAAILKVGSSAGLVMAAAYEKRKGTGDIYAKHLVRARELVGNKLWFLIPGIGTQGGFVGETVRAAWAGYGSMAMNSSSGIIFAEDSAFAARTLRDQINSAIPK